MSVMSEQNSTLVRRAIEEIWNRGNYARLEEFVTDDIVIHGATPAADIRGIEGIKQFYGGLRAAFPDIRFSIEDQIAAGDRVVTRWTARATHTGDFQGIPPTGEPVLMMGIDIDRFANGKVVECWPIADELGLLHQLGVVPPPGQVER